MSVDLSAWRSAVLADPRVGIYGRQIAEVLARSFADQGICSLSHERLADAALIIVGANAVRKTVARLEQFGWLAIERPSDRRRHGTIYRPVLPASARPVSESV
jgi:hypothetical protein